MAKSKRKWRLNADIGIDPNSDVEREVEVGVVGNVGGSSKLTREIHEVKRTKIAATSTDIAQDIPPPVPPEEVKKRKQVRTCI